MIPFPRLTGSLGSLVGATSAFLRIVKAPVIDPIIALRQRIMERMGPAGVARLTDALRSAPALAEMFAGRYLAPDYRVEDLGGCAPGTLGHAFHAFMTDNGRSLDYIPRTRPASDYAYYSRRIEETHDLWHVVLGYRPDLPGEIAVLSFLLGHMLRDVKRERGAASRFGGLLLLGLLGHVAVYQRPLLRPALASLVDGARRGLSTRPLWAVRWEEMWHRPLAEVRAEALAPLAG